MQNQAGGDSDNSPIFLPYSPRLRELLKSYGAALLLIYLEQHFPASQDHPNQPVIVGIDRTRVDLQLTSLAFWNHLKMIAVGWRSAKRRLLARQAGREFLTSATRGAGAYKPYSYLRIDKHTLEICRNHSRIRHLLEQAGIPAVPQSSWLYVPKIVDGGGFSVDLSEFAAQNPRELAREMAKSLAPLDDGRRKAGIKRRFARRSPWTEERRNKFMATMKERYGWGGANRSISDVDME